MRFMKKHCNCNKKVSLCEKTNMGYINGLERLKTGMFCTVIFKFVIYQCVYWLKYRPICQKESTDGTMYKKVRVDSL